jgi:hypothetical protein
MAPENGESSESGQGELNPPASSATSAPFAERIDPTVLELDHVFSVLSHPRRRYLMYALAENPEWTLTELATKLVAWETEDQETTVDARHRDQMYVSLYHTHVPKLDSEGVVEFDRETETIARGEHAEQVFTVLAGAGGSEDFAQEQHASRDYESERDTTGR